MKDKQLAIKNFPTLHFDKEETLLPIRIGWRVYRSKGIGDHYNSPAFHRTLFFIRELTNFGKDTHTIIEYSLWYKADIQHIWEMEHVWVYLDDNGDLVAIEGSRHANVSSFDIKKKILVEPGKHGLFQGENQERLKQLAIHICTHPGSAGLDFSVIKAPNFMNFKFEIERIYRKSPETDKKIQEYLKEYGYKPSFLFSKRFEPSKSLFSHWEEFEPYVKRYFSEQLRKILAC